jgi:hypothetical protein
MPKLKQNPKNNQDVRHLLDVPDEIPVERTLGSFPPPDTSFAMPTVIRREDSDDDLEQDSAIPFEPLPEPPGKQVVVDLTRQLCECLERFDKNLLHPGDREFAGLERHAKICRSAAELLWMVEPG